MDQLKDIIEKNHYSGRLSSCRYPLGVFYQTDNQHQFFDEDEEKLIGVACYGFPVGRRVIGSIFKEEILENKKILDSVRVSLKNTLSNPLKSTPNFDKNTLFESLHTNTFIKHYFKHSIFINNLYERFKRTYKEIK